MSEFLEGFDSEREAVSRVLLRLEQTWDEFRSRDALDVAEDAERTGSLIGGELSIARTGLANTQFTVGVFGLIKRGKSTLMNALIGREVSAMHVTPETAVPVYVSYAEQPSAVVHFADGRAERVNVADVGQYTSQKHNPSNELGVTHVEQCVPVPFLRNGTRLIDTPGLDDAEADETYTERTMQELDVVDAGIIVFLSPPTVGATEMGFLERVVSRDMKKTFLVCNMYPQHFHDPDTREAVLNYVGGRITEACRRAGLEGDVRVYPVCALESWNARSGDDVDQWVLSGSNRLLRDLEEHLADSSGRAMLAEAAERVAKVAEMASGEAQVRIQLLSDPSRLASHRATLDSSVQQLEGAFEAACQWADEQADKLKGKLRPAVVRPFLTAPGQIELAETTDDLHAYTKRLKREVEVAGEYASRNFERGFGQIVDRVKVTLEKRFEAVMTDMAGDLPRVELSSAGLMSSSELLFEADASSAARTATVAGGAVGGLATGGALLATGAVLLGPVGLLGGALVGSQVVSRVKKASDFKKAKRDLDEQLEVVSQQLLADFDKQVDDAVAALRRAVTSRRTAFAGDVYGQLDLVERLSSDPATAQAHAQEMLRYSQQFQQIAGEARAAMAAVPAGV